MALGKSKKIGLGSKAGKVDLDSIANSESTAGESGGKGPVTTSPIDAPSVNREKGLLGRVGTRTRTIKLPVTRNDVMLMLEHVDPRDTWVDANINPRDQNILRPDDPSIVRLREGIVREGQRDPVLLRRNPGPNGETFEVIYGSCRRYVALLETESRADAFPLVAEIGDISNNADAVRLARSENQDREDLSAWEKAVDMNRLMDSVYKGLTHDDIAKAMGVSRRTVTNYIKLVKLPASVLNLLKNPRSMKLSEGLSLVRGIEEGGASAEKALADIARRGESFDKVSRLQKEIAEVANPARRKSVTSKKPQIIKGVDGEDFARISAIRGSEGRYKIDLHHIDNESLEKVLEFLEKLSK